jgi:23S rRNA (guanosine2251-2'-O)-methyltransferase
LNSNLLECGLRAIEAAIGIEGRVVSLYCDQSLRNSRRQALCDRAVAAGIEVHYVEKKRLDEKTEGARHQGLVALCRVEGPMVPGLADLLMHLDNLNTMPLLLVVDGLQDPRNLGACWRSAAALGAHALVMPKGRGADITATVTRVAAGGASQVPMFQVSNWSRALTALKKHGIWLIGADESSHTSVGEVDLKLPTALVVGGEERGIRPITRKQCDSMGRIPTSTTFGSLNVSVAVGVLLYEVARQRAK